MAGCPSVYCGILGDWRCSKKKGHEGMHESKPKWKRHLEWTDADATERSIKKLANLLGGEQ